ncbi:hypothetical protein PsYK624_053820 [Phanerochaete sordida]|uniref:Uncharacterized protein n=1 Tax=Phanerochaete sordida TaxID=48140 RepID=A0A9P3G7K5_9APHY|nr:hypothetical protein PsYK624_053820 [Phanerochaete sordida]
MRFRRIQPHSKKRPAGLHRGVTLVGSSSARWVRVVAKSTDPGSKGYGRAASYLNRRLSAYTCQSVPTFLVAWPIARVPGAVAALLGA